MDALAYAGDTLRDLSTTNLQVQEPNDVRVVLNGDRYWQSSDGTTDPATGYGLDYGSGDPTKKPCATSSLDAKATDHEAPPLWGLIPLTPSPKTHAKVEIHQVLEQTGMLPLAVPEVDPQAVAAIFVDEFNGNVLAALELIPGSCPDPDGIGPLPAYPYKCWGVDFPSVLVNTDNIGVVVLVSRNDTDPDLGGSLTTICGQDPGFVICYAGDGNQDGLSFIHGFSTSSSGVTLQTPTVRDVKLIDGNCAVGGDHSSPYFLFNGECTVGIQAVIDFGTAFGSAAAAAAFPNCVTVTSSPGGVLTYSGDVADGTLFTGSSHSSKALVEIP